MSIVEIGSKMEENTQVKENMHETEQKTEQKAKDEDSQITKQKSLRNLSHLSPVSSTAASILPSTTLAITAKANQMKASGIDVIGFGAGEPDFDTPQNIKESAIKAIGDGFTKYTPTAGIAELRKAIAEKLLKDNGIEYDAEDIMVSSGAKQALFNIIMALVNVKDQVLIPEPYWNSYVEMVKIASGKPVIVKTTGFKPTAAKIAAKCNSRTKLLILNSPSNPTGAIADADELHEIAKLCIDKGIYVISDEIYEKLIYERDHVSIASLGEEIKNLTITINGVSKAYAMTGWRIGYAAGPNEIIRAAVRIQDHTTSGANSIAQKAALEALKGQQESIEHMRREFKIRRDLIVERLNRMRGVTIRKPEGAFYAFPNVSRLYNTKIPNSDTLANALLEEAKIAVVPGSAFGAAKYIRLSFAASIENIIEGMDRMEHWIRKNYRTL